MAAAIPAALYQDEFLVSIVVVNYNYERFLPAAIDSALNQTYRNVEVIVVDDGSTDGSRQIIASFGNEVIPVYKANGGQASAFNAGFRQARGEVVIFLDADDTLRYDTVERVAEVFRASPEIARVQYRLEVIDASGRQNGMIVPPKYIELPNTDFRRDVSELINCASWSPTSGNAFAAWSLRQILPMPERGFRICADFYLSRVNALFGPVSSLDGVGAYYRYHGANRFLRLSLDLNQVREHIVLAHLAHHYIHDVAQSVGIAEYPKPTDPAPDGTDLLQRMISLKLDRERHPVPGDTLVSLCWHGSRAALKRKMLPIRMRIIYVAWFIAMLVSPQAGARVLAELFFPDQHTVFGRRLRILKRGVTRQPGPIRTTK